MSGTGKEIPVFKYDLFGKFITEYNSFSQAKKDCGVAVGSITRAIDNLWQAGGYQWRKEYFKEIDPYSTKKRAIRKISVGNVYFSDAYGNYKVIKFSHKDKSKRSHYYVKFEKTNFEEEFNSNTIMNGKAIDYMCPTVYGIACLGGRNKDNPKTMKTWRSMIKRCYGEHENSHLYTNTSVCERWLNFQNFNSDLTFIDGYDKDKFHSGELVLDKDLKQLHKSKKLYSLETCTFLTRGENARISYKNPHAGRTFVALSPEGIFYEDKGISNFAKIINLNKDIINSSLRNKKYIVGEWVFGDETMTKEELIVIKKTKGGKFNE